VQNAWDRLAGGLIVEKVRLQKESIETKNFLESIIEKAGLCDILSFMQARCLKLFHPKNVTEPRS
jgi:hypothetical protein